MSISIDKKSERSANEVKQYLKLQVVDTLHDLLNDSLLLGQYNPIINLVVVNYELSSDV